MNKWTQKTEIPVWGLIRMIGVCRSKFYNWRERYGMVRRGWAKGFKAIAGDSGAATSDWLTFPPPCGTVSVSFVGMGEFSNASTVDRACRIRFLTSA